MLPNIVGLCGRSRVGKDTIASILMEKYPTYTLHRLAQPVKDTVKTLYDFTQDQVETDEKEKMTHWGITPRQAMVWVTETMMQRHGNDFFSRKLFDAYDNGVFGSNIIIPDIRYAHDLYEIRKRGGIVIKVVRSGMPDHQFEAAVDQLEGDVLIDNNGTLVELQKKVEDVFANLVKPNVTV